MKERKIEKRMDKNKSYCYKCYIENGILTELEFDKNTNLFISPKCGHYKNGFHRLSFISKYDDWLPVPGLNPNARSKREIIDSRKEPGICSMPNCGKYNLSRDQNGRGRDVGYGDGKWIADEDIVIRVKDINSKIGYKTLLIKKGIICGCDCSQKWFTKHNQTQQMRDQAIEAGKKYGVQNLINYNKSEKHREKAAEIGNLTWKENFKYITKYCSICKKETLHKGKSEICTDCNPSALNGTYKEYCEKCGKITTHSGNYCMGCNPEKFGFVGNIKYIKIHMKKCNICEKETPHRLKRNKKDNANDSLECLVCSVEYVWCEKCNQWENIHFNSKPLHWVYYKSRSKTFAIENEDIINNFLLNIIGLNLIINLNNNDSDHNDFNGNNILCGIYTWYIDNVPYYVGQSKDFLSRIYDHVYEMFNYPEFWVNIVNEINNGHTLEIKFDKYKKEDLDKMELLYINILKPMSQKCDGNDNVILFENRDYDINNLKEKYNERINKK